jgi:hypothetical protein
VTVRLLNAGRRRTDDLSMRLRHALALLSVAAGTPVLVAAPAHATPCVTATRTVTGMIAGEDHRYVDALLGFDFVDSAGRHVDAKPGSATFGCTGVHGYGVTIRVNGSLPATGSTTSGTKYWSVKVPANVTMAYIEVYPQAAGYGGTNESRYGHALRRKMPIPYNKTVLIRLPLICSVGGHVGWINGYVSKNGVRVKADRVAAWSMATDNNTASPILGWNIGSAATNGYYKIPNLASGQAYTVQIWKDGVLRQKYGVTVNACKGSYLGGSF